MRKIKDRVLLSTVSGLLSPWAGRFLNPVLVKAGLSDYDYDRVAAGLFLDNSLTTSSEGKITGTIVNETNTMLVALLTTYILSLTGRDRAIIKGAGVGLVSWVLINGALSGLGLKKKSRKPLTPLFNLFDQVTIGALCGLLSARLGDDSLFPDGKVVREDGRLPVFST